MSSLQVHSERSARTGICIVWPANFPGSTDPELHATALFLGNIETVDFTKEDLQKVLVNFPGPGDVEVTGTAMFGRNSDVPVLTLSHDWLLVISRIVIEERLKRLGIEVNTEFGFNPHVTVAKCAEHVQKALFRPASIHLESPVLWWGDERTIHSQRIKWVAAV